MAIASTTTTTTTHSNPTRGLDISHRIVVVDKDDDSHPNSIYITKSSLLFTVSKPQ
jgi:hypothetical protein